MAVFNPLDPMGQLNNQQGNNWINSLDFSGNRTAVPPPGGNQSGINGLGNSLSNAGLGLNLPTLQLGLSGLGALNSIFQGRQANRLARDQLNFARDVTNTNLNNQIQSYNTALEDRARTRGVVEGRSPDYTDEYIERNRLSR